jgi:hypothetical protein
MNTATKLGEQAPGARTNAARDRLDDSLHSCIHIDGCRGLLTGSGRCFCAEIEKAISNGE